MSLSISNLMVSNNAPPGSVVGVLSAQNESGQLISCNFSLTKGSSGSFAINGNKLVTAWNGSTVPGYYSVRISAVGTNTRFSTRGTFAIQVVPPPPPPSAPPPPPPPLSVDGSQISPLSGSPIRTKDGSWSFGPLDPDGVNAPILLNGAPAENFHGHVIAVANGGQLYVRG